MSALAKGIIAAVLALSCVLLGIWYISFRGQLNTNPLNPEPLAGNKSLTLTTFELPDLNGNLVSSNNYSGKLKIVHFWASWCAPCLEEFPSLLRFSNSHKESLVVFAISVDESKKDVANFIRAFGVIPENVKVLLDPTNSFATKMGTSKLPESYLFFLDGRLHRKYPGSANWNDPIISSEFFSREEK